MNPTRVAAWGARSSLAGAILASTCCVVPGLLSLLGLGGAVAGAVSAVPALTLLSVYKASVFVSVGLLLGASWATITGRVPTRWLRARLCPMGAAPRHPRRVWWLASAIYLVSLATAYLGAPVARLIWR